ncbi:hypothetical protein CP985_05200 [Malaciobacter mytili LMG 24559]|uniref:Cyclic nucleotide-binding domain-containing protein n=1 Tax=Malaciobacter mytili LMG 24559 TaxID=1032238 RepID=A0AAX2AJ06_9BACT|nr:Crp/Fnr family transcriptional regulator [Malaciobacter mytili]AXH15689.1 transcriptional regulator, Crp/Fnr family [Malaciobacter mytili LMG 24559]RXK16125.1 hypothetical protein CP985_05200 [Malaciobacter mytili LMG 24559]
MKKYIKEYFSTFTDEMIEEILNICKMITYPKDKIVFYEGDKAFNLFLLVDGEICVYKTNENGSTQVLRYFKPLCLIAELANVDEIPYPATGKCEKESKVIIIDYKKYITLFENKEEMLLAQKVLMDSISKKLYYHVNLNSFRPIRKLSILEQVVSLILEDISILNEKKHWKVAQDLGISAESLSRTLTKLKEQKLISMDEYNTLSILNRQKLKSYLIK